jgi:hypothetical protein
MIDQFVQDIYLFSTLALSDRNEYDPYYLGIGIFLVPSSRTDFIVRYKNLVAQASLQILLYSTVRIWCCVTLASSNIAMTSKGSMRTTDSCFSFLTPTPHTLHKSSITPFIKLRSRRNVIQDSKSSYLGTPSKGDNRTNTACVFQRFLLTPITHSWTEYIIVQ